MGQTSPDFGGIPPWLRYFLIHVVKRCAMVFVTWINEMEKALKQ